MELEFDLEKLRESSENTRKVFDELIGRADKQYDIARSLHQLDRQLARAMEALPQVLNSVSLPSDLSRIRGTIHVPDILFENYFYQITDYFPDARAGGPHGRRFSQRFGIIGRSWRLKESKGRADAVVSPENAVENLIMNWGMNSAEASKARTRQNPADLCIILHSTDEDGLRIGLLFLDSADRNAFGANDDEHKKLIDALEAREEVKSLAKALTGAMVLLRIGISQIRIDA